MKTEFILCKVHDSDKTVAVLEPSRGANFSRAIIE